MIDRRTIILVSVFVVGIVLILVIGFFPARKLPTVPPSAVSQQLKTRAERIETLRSVLDDPVFRRLPSDLEKLRAGTQ